MYSFSDILQYGLLYLTDQRGAAAIVFSVLGICIVGYLLGGINFGIIVSKVRYRDDIRKHGSGNAGLTNMLRTYGKGAAAATLIGDVLKTILPCFIGSIVLGQTGAFFAGFAAVIGHMWPVWFNFKGGKGVLSLAAVTLYCCPPFFLVMITIFFIIVAATKFISLGSVICALLYPIVLSRFIGTQNFVIIPAAVIAFIIVFRHRSNIKRLYNKNENKIKLSEKGIKPWILIVIGVLLTAASVVTVYFTYIKGTYVIKYKDAGVTSVQYGVICVDERFAYMKENGIDFDKKEDADKKAVMAGADSRASRILVLGKIASERGFSISGAGSERAKNYFADNLSALPGYKEGDTAETYCHRVYGNSVSPLAVTELIRREIYAEEYAVSIGEEEAEKQLEEAIGEGEKNGTFKLDRKAAEKVVNKY